jgi:sugar/nucleoside kinase (ribokinase family)
MASNLSANEDLKPNCLNLEKLSKSDWLLFDAFSVCTTNGLKTAKKALSVAKQNKLKIAFGLAHINLIQTNLTEIKWVLDQHIDLLFGNEKEINLLNEKIKPNCNVLCSYGAKGCRYNLIQVKAKETSIVNTNGAGDALIGVFLSHLDSLDNEGALREAVDYATQVCLVGGPRL